MLDLSVAKWHVEELQKMIADAPDGLMEALVLSKGISDFLACSTVKSVVSTPPAGFSS